MSPPQQQPRPLTAGDAAPGFTQASTSNPRYAFDTAAGRYLVLCFLGLASDPHARAALDAVHARPDLFDDHHASFFGVSLDPDDQTSGRLASRIPGFRHFWDFDKSVSRLYGILAPQPDPDTGSPVLARQWVIIDPSMRVVATIPFQKDRADIGQALALVQALPPPERHTGTVIMAPVLFLPRVFEPEFCRHLIGLYEAQGGEESGFMRQIDGRTVGVYDLNVKSRRDYTIEDRTLIAAIQARFSRRVLPEIQKVHQFKATRMERYIVSCYSADEGGHFSAHRDNTTSGTAHRQFAVSVNLNDEFDGGEVSFPEYGPRGFKAPPGGAVVFSCSLLHKVSKVTAGRRFAFLPFLYNDAAAQLRERNAALVGEQGSSYRAGG